MTVARPKTGVRYALEQRGVAAGEATFEGFAHLPEVDVPLTAHVTIANGSLKVVAAPTEGVSDARLAELTKTATALLRAATKAEIAAGKPLPRKIARWRG